MADIDYNSLFGLDDGGNEQEVAEPAADMDETADVVEETYEEPADDSDFNDSAEDQTPDNSQGRAQKSREQTPEERSRYAAARRKAEAERDAEIERIRAEAQADVQRQVDEAFAASGMVNPYTGQPIKTKADFDAYQARFSQENKTSFIRKAGLSENEFQQFIESLPEVRQARAAQAEAEKVKAQAEAARAKATVDEQIAEITKLDPNIKSIEDLAKMPTYTTFYDLVQRGNNFVEAFKLANFDTLTTKAQKAAQQRTLTNTNGKSHLTPRPSRGTGQDPVPADVIAEYRTFMPDATEAEISRHYNAYRKTLK